MDRLVCGDVGFGKTEVALRAAAAAVFAGKQAAIVAPTTVLVRQHLQTFRRRFAGLGVRIEALSRLSPPAEARAGKIESQWVAMARRPEDLAAVVSRAGWRSLTFSDPQLVWTDDYSNLLSVLRLT